MSDAPTPVPGRPPDVREPIDLLLRDLRSRRGGLTGRDAARRLVIHGPNELRRARRRSWSRAIVRQLTHPLALLLWAAAVLAFGTGLTVVGLAVVAVILLNAVFAFVQEWQAERAVEALAEYLPPHATALRDGHPQQVDARLVVPGDVLLVAEGDRICADIRLLDGVLDVDTSAITGESMPVTRAADAPDTGVALLDRPDMLFSGTACIGGEASGLVVATGMDTELGRIAALSQRGEEEEESPLEREVRRVAWLIALVAVSVGLAFLPLGTLVAGLPLADATSFAIGLLIGNVPEGLLPTITLSLALGVGLLARRGALVKRLSAVETLGSATVICTDKTGTLTQNRMSVVRLWTPDSSELTAPTGEGFDPGALRAGVDGRLVRAVASCNNADLGGDGGEPVGDATEVALLRLASDAGWDVDRGDREARRLRAFSFDPTLQRMSTVDVSGDDEVTVHTKGAPESVVPLCTDVAATGGGTRPLTDAERTRIGAAVDRYASEGLRVLAVASRTEATAAAPERRDAAEADLVLLGLVAMVDPPRPEVAPAVARCREAGIRIIIVTGDHGLTAKAIATRVGLAGDEVRIVTGADLAAMSDDRLDALLREPGDLIFARTSPEAKLRIADGLRAEGNVVAMTGDGVNDAPALRRADIGVAMGRSGTDVAREAATMVLTDDNFASIVAAVEEGRRVYDNIRKFVFYIFVHATPEVVPFLLFAVTGGAIPLPLTALQILAIDLGTETLPALALGREPAEPGLMQRPPRRRGEGVIRREMLIRAWLFLGMISAALVMAGFLAVLLAAGWSPGDPTGEGTPLHDAYVQATTMTFLGIVACQLGTGLAARTERASLRSVGLWTNPLLLWGFAFEVVFAASLIGVPAFADAFGMARPPADALAMLIAFPVIVWGADELRRWRLRVRASG